MFAYFITSKGSLHDTSTSSLQDKVAIQQFVKK